MSAYIRFPSWLFGASSSTKAALTALLSLDTSAQEKIKNAVRELGPPYSKKKLTEKSRQLHDELKVLDADTLYTIVDTLTDLIGFPPNYSYEILTELFKDTGLPYTKLESMVKEIAADPDYARLRAIQDFKNLALPGIRSLEHYCAVRARFNKSFDYNEGGIESYSPEIADYHPVAIFKLVIDGSEEDSFFQLDQENLDRLISQLVAAQRQLKIVADDLKKSAR